MFRLVSFLCLALAVGMAATVADAGERQGRRALRQGNGSHGGYRTFAPQPEAYTAPPEVQIAPPVAVVPQTMMVQGPPTVEKRMVEVEVDVLVPGPMVEVAVPLAYTAPCAPMLFEAPLCPEARQQRERRRRARVEQRRLKRSSHLGIEEPDAPLPQDQQPTPAE